MIYGFILKEKKLEQKFLHLAKKNYSPTKGCVAISKKDFLKIIPLIKKKTKITIS